VALASGKMIARGFAPVFAGDHLPVLVISNWRVTRDRTAGA
jgi:hypothetical protein